MLYPWKWPSKMKTKERPTQADKPKELRPAILPARDVRGTALDRKPDLQKSMMHGRNGRLEMVI
jgi:hypothetical protein